MGRRVAAQRKRARWRTIEGRVAAVVAGGLVLTLGISACAMSTRQGHATDTGGSSPQRSTPSSAAPDGSGANGSAGSETLVPSVSGAPTPSSVPAPSADAPDTDAPDTDTPDADAPKPGNGSSPAPASPDGPIEPSALTADDQTTLKRYAVDTWSSMDAMLIPETGLVADHIDSELRAPAPYTSPTNIGGYLWSLVVARDLGIVTPADATVRFEQTLSTLSSMERHGPSGMFYNWYSPQTKAKLTVWPDDDEPITPFLSSVDNGWLAASLRVVAAADPAVASQALGLSKSMDFSWFLDEKGAAGAGLTRVGFWEQRPSDDCSEPDGAVFSSCASYNTMATEARITTYVGIANGQLPESAYVAPSRTGPVAVTGAGWMRSPHGSTNDYKGVSVLESTYAYDGMNVVPSWNGSMFEELMPDLFVPEAQWGTRSWGLNHAATVAAQKSHVVGGTGAGVWGVSPAADPAGGYGEFGIDGLSIRATLAAAGLTGAAAGASDPRRPGTPERSAASTSDTVVTPHASFLALPYDPRGAMDNLERLSEEFDLYGAGGFSDSVDVASGTVAKTYLSLDQSMILASIGNAVGDDLLKHYFVDDSFEKRVRPLVEQAEFGTTLG